MNRHDGAWTLAFCGVSVLFGLAVIGIQAAVLLRWNWAPEVGPQVPPAWAWGSWIAIAVLGTLYGGFAGYALFIRKAKGPREYAFAIRLSIVYCMLFAVCALCLIVLPKGLRLLALPLIVVLGFGFRWWGKAQQRIRAEETDSLQARPVCDSGLERWH